MSVSRCPICKRTSHEGKCEYCKRCGKVILVMSQRGTGLCNENCRKHNVVNIERNAINE